jgi:hypothetical protein
MSAGKRRHNTMTAPLLYLWWYNKYKVGSWSPWREHIFKNVLYAVLNTTLVLKLIYCNCKYNV